MKEGQGNNTEGCLKEQQKTLYKPTENAYTYVYILIFKVNKRKREREREGWRESGRETERGNA